MGDLLAIDGAHGEGGGQILRTSLALAAITGRPIRVERIRAGRKNPGLAAQHLTAVRAAAEICSARLEGDELGSRRLDFSPGGPPRPGRYAFDVSLAREGGSAGAATLVLQTVLLPLALAPGESSLSVRGGTHVPWSPPADHLAGIFLRALGGMGVEAEARVERWGWYPAGGGEIRAEIRGAARNLPPLRLIDRGRLLGVRGRAVASRLPDHIPRRMAGRATDLLAHNGVEARLEALTAEAACPGAGIFLAAEYEGVAAGFGALGRRGVPAEAVAEEAVASLLAHRASGAALEEHLADQILLPAALADGESRFTVERVSLHLTTAAWLLERFGLARAHVEKDPGTGCPLVRVEPLGGGPRAPGW